MNNDREWFRRRQQRLQVQLKYSRQRLEDLLGESVLLENRIQKLSWAIKRYRILTTGEVEDDETMQLLQQQLAQTQTKQAEAKRDILKSRRQIRQIIRALWKLWQIAERIKRQLKTGEIAAAPPKPAQKTPFQDPLTGHVVPSYKPPNPQRALRNLPRNNFKMTVLPNASVGLALQAVLAFSIGALPFAVFALVTLTALWLFTAMFELLRQ